MNPTIEELKAAIEIMREVYPFKDDKTAIELRPDVRNKSLSEVELTTKDYDRNTTIILRREVTYNRGKYAE